MAAPRTVLGAVDAALPRTGSTCSTRSPASRTGTASRTRRRSSVRDAPLPAAVLRAQPASLVPRCSTRRCRRTSSSCTPRRRVGGHGLARHRGQRAAGGRRGGEGARRPRRRPGQPADAVHLRRRARCRSTWSTSPSRSTSRCGPRRRRRAGRRVRARSASDLRPGAATARRCSSGSAPSPTRRCRGSPAVAGFGCGRRCSATACSPRPGRRARPGRAAHGLVPVRLPRAYAWVAPHERVRMLRTENTNDPALIARQPRMVDQLRAPGRPVRPGQRLTDRRPHLLRLRRPDRLRRRGAALARRPGADRAAVVAPAGRRLHDRAAGRRAGHVLPDTAVVTEQGVARCLGARPARAGPAPHRRTPPTRASATSCGRKPASSGSSDAAGAARHSRTKVASGAPEGVGDRLDVQQVVASAACTGRGSSTTRTRPPPELARPGAAVEARVGAEHRRAVVALHPHLEVAVPQVVAGEVGRLQRDRARCRPGR